MSKFKSLKTERSLLSTIIKSKEGLDEVFEKASGELFFNKTNRAIFEILKENYYNSLPFHETLIVSKLQALHGGDKSEYENILLDIISSPPLPDPLIFLDVLQDLSKKRKIENALSLIQNALTEEISSHELEALIQKEFLAIEERIRDSLLNIECAYNIKSVEPEFILKGWLPFPKSTVSMITAPGGSGKSWLSLQIAARFAMENKDQKTFLWLSEDPIGLSADRLKKITKEILNLGGMEEVDVKKRIFISDDPTFSILLDDRKKMSVNHKFFTLKSILKDYSLIILDPLIGFFGGDENNNSHARQFMQLFTDWASKEKKVIIFVHHSTKNTTQSRGASAFIDAVRLLYELEPIKDRDGNIKKSEKRVLKIAKDNYGAAKITNSNTIEVDLFPAHQKVKEISSKSDKFEDDKHGLDIR